MKTSANKHGQVPSQRTFTLNPVAAGCAVFISIMTNAAYAQEAAPAAAPAAVDPATTQVVTVAGIRRGIEAAISVKKDASSIVEAISAEDIGKLPDTTIAESLARLPGLTTQRTNSGQGSTVSIRGLGPDFNGYLLNGREQTGTGDSRSIDLSVYPAELIAGATVYKTNDATVVGQGLAGTIDQKLIDPLAFGKRVLSANVQKNKNGVGLDTQGTGKRASFTYIDQFADRQIGVAIGLVHSSGSSGQYDYGSWGDFKGNVKDTSGATVANVTVPSAGGWNIDTKTITDKRDGVAAILAYKPNRNFNSQLDVFYSKVQQYTKINQLQIPGSGDFSNASVSGGIATSATMNNVGLIDRNEGLIDNDTIKSVGWKNTLKLSGGWTTSVDLSHNSAERVERDDEYYGGLAANSTLTLTGLGKTVPHMVYGASLTDPATMAVRNQCGWSGVSNSSACGSVSQAGYAKGPTTTDTVSAYRFDVKKELPDGSMFTDVQFGANYSDRSKDRVTNEGLIISATGGGYDRIPFPAGSTVVNNVGGTGLNVLSFDPQVALIPGAVILPKYNDDILSKTFGVAEKVTTAYGQLNIDTTIANIPVRGNIGLQLVHTDQSSTGYRANVGASPVLTNPSPTLSVDGTTFNDFLPSMNLNSDLGDGNQLRLAVSKELSRANLTDLRNAFAFSANLTPGTVNGVALAPFWSGSAGNPHLQPYRADAIDLSFEKYFGKKGYVSAAVFYKKLNNYIVPQLSVVDFAPLLAAFGKSPLPAPSNQIGTLSTTVNGSGGNLKGIELTASAPFSMIHPMLDGFGTNGSYSYTQSSVNLPDVIGLKPTQAPNAGSIPLPGLSKVNAKLMLYFEKKGFSAFIADNLRSRYVGSVDNSSIGGFTTLQFIEEQKWVSAQVGYEIQDGPMKGLSLRLEGNNLNSPYYQETNSNGSVNARTQTGRTIIVSLSYKM